MTRILALFLLVVAGATLQPGALAAPIDLNGVYQGRWVDKGRDLGNSLLRMHITQQGELVRGAALDNTLWVQGSLRGNRVILQWEHASGNYGDGFWDVLDGGRRLVGTWDSKGSRRLYGTWELERP